MHAAHVHHVPAELRGALLVPGLEHLAEDPQELREAHALGGGVLLEVPLQQGEGLDLGHELDAAVLRPLGQLPHVLHEPLHVHEAGDGHGVAALLHEEVGGEAARGVAGEGGLRAVREAGDELGDGGDEGHRVPVVLREPARLLLHVLGEVRQGVTELLPVLVGHAAREGDRLVVDALDDVDVVDGETQDLPDLVVVEGVDHGGDEADGGAGVRGHLPHPLDDLLLRLEEGDAPGEDVVLLLQPVELEVDRVEARLVGVLEEARLVGEQDAVGGHLDLGEAHLPGRLDGLHELRVDGGLAPRELEGVHGHRALGPEDRELVDDLLVGGLEDVARGVRVREADGALQVAAVREVDVAQGGVGVVEVAEAALVGADGGVGDLRVGDAHPVVGPGFGLQVQVDVRPAHLVELAVLLARLPHHQLPVLLVEGGGDDGDAFGTQGARAPREALVQLGRHGDHGVLFPGLLVALDHFLGGVFEPTGHGHSWTTGRVCRCGRYINTL